MLDYLSDHDRVCLIEFGSKGRRITPIRFCTDANIEKVFYPAIEDIEAEGGTSIIDGLIVAQEVLKKRRFHNKVTSIFLLSDGEDNKLNDKKLGDLVNNYDKWCAQNKAIAKEELNFSINCFGYGEDCNEDQLTMISEKRGGNFYYVEKPEEVKTAFIECLARTLSVIANDAVIDLVLKPSKFFPEICIKKVFEKLWKGENETKRKLLQSHLIAGRNKNSVVHLNFGELPNNIEDLMIELEFQDEPKILIGEVLLTGFSVYASQKIVKKQEIWIEITFPKKYDKNIPEPDLEKVPDELDETNAGNQGDETDALIFDNQVMLHNARVETAEKIFEIRDCVNNNDQGKARSRCSSAERGICEQEKNQQSDDKLNSSFIEEKNDVVIGIRNCLVDIRKEVIEWDALEEENVKLLTIGSSGGGGRDIARSKIEISKKKNRMGKQLMQEANCNYYEYQAPNSCQQFYGKGIRALQKRKK